MNTDDIRNILERFYDGAASPGEIEQVRNYFAGAEEIPADLRANAAMFRAMNCAISRPEELPVPADLKKRILAATVGAAPVRRRFGWKISLAAAAAAAVVITVATLIFNMPRTDASGDRTFIAGSSSSTASDNSASVKTDTAAFLPPIADENLSAEKHVAQSVPQVKRGKRTHNASLGTIIREESLAANYREVTDSAEAVQITNSILATLAENLAKAENGINESEAAMRSVRERLDRIYERL